VGGLAAVGVDEVDPHITAGQGADDGSERGGRAAAPPDDLAEVVRMDMDLEQLAPTLLAGSHPYVVRVVDYAADQVLERVG
jgi:hypothetical protein